MANTIGGFVRLDDLERHAALVIILCGLGGAVGWNLLTGAGAFPPRVRMHWLGH